jgi:hypothetical protein
LRLNTCRTSLIASIVSTNHGRGGRVAGVVSVSQLPVPSSKPMAAEFGRSPGARGRAVPFHSPCRAKNHNFCQGSGSILSDKIHIYRHFVPVGVELPHLAKPIIRNP